MKRKKRKLKKHFKILFYILSIIILLFFSYKIIVSYEQKIDRIEKTKNDCIKNAASDGEKYFCY